MGSGRPPIEDLEARIGHVFSDKTLIKGALTHVSALGTARRAQTNERLEFLGDRVLGLAIAELLFEKFPKAEEGEMSRRFADLVRKETCANVARRWDVGPHLHVGPSEVRSGGRERTTILGDACEALIAAVFLDAGYDVARALVFRGFADLIVETLPPVVDPKSVLQEWAQGRGLPTPLYREVSRTGPDHKPQFVIAVEVQGFASAEASGASKRFAEQSAAQVFLQREGLPKSRASSGAEAAP
jgi:ribonuclease-3